MDASKLVAGVLTSPDDAGNPGNCWEAPDSCGYNPLIYLEEFLSNLVATYPNFGGVCGWTFQNALNEKGKKNSVDWAKAITKALNKNNKQEL